jgi:hypothetical protein
VPLEKLENYIEKLDLVYQTRGQLGLLTYVKSTRSSLMSYISGTKSYNSGIKLTKDGIPKNLGALIPYIRGSSLRALTVLPFLNTVLWSTRALKLGKKPDLEPISTPARQGL